MDNLINSNQNFLNNNSLIGQKDLKDNNNNIEQDVLNPFIKIVKLKKKRNNLTSSHSFKNKKNFIRKRRKKLGKKKNVGILNKTELPEIPLDSILFLKHEIEKRMNKKIQLEEDIQNMKERLNNINFEIENYEKIEKFLENFNIGKEVFHEEKDKIKIKMENHWDDNGGLKFSLDKYSDPIQKLYSQTHLQTLTLKKETNNPDSQIKSKKNQIFENIPSGYNNLRNPFLNIETIQEFTVAKEKNVISNEDIEKYSFNCLKKNFNFKIKKGTKEIPIEFIIENNGKLTWPENEAFLLIDEKRSVFKIQKLNLHPLRPQEQSLVSFKFDNLDKYETGLYKNYLVFNVKGKNFGNNILINIEIY